jgi:hypothetical protein
MNINNLILPLLFVSIPLSAMKLEPGTVIDPINHVGQFTVSIAEGSLNSLPSGLPTAVSQASKAGSDIFKNKGIPVIISTAVGMIPWWALTTGTGYLIISQCGFSDPTLITTVATGASSFAGEQSTSLLKKYINNPYAKSFTQIALCASCLGASYLSGNPLITNAFYAAGNAIGLQSIFETCSEYFAQSKANAPASESQTWYTLSPTIKRNLFDGTTNALSIIIPTLCITNACDSNMMLRILLHEQAYRLAQCGCTAAQHFINK